MTVAEKRRKIVSWWTFYKLDTKEDPQPEDFEEWALEANQNPMRCHEILRTEYQGYYVPSKPRVTPCK